MQRRLTRVAPGMLLLALGALVWSCDAGEMMADAMVDASDAMRDAATVVRDAAGSDAAAQAPIDVGCNVERMQRVEYDDGRWTETTRWTAEIEDASLSETSRVRWVLCDRVTFGDASSVCDLPNVTCTGTDPFPEPLRCQVVNGAQVETGRARDFSCGLRTVQGNASGVLSDGGFRWTSVRAFIE